MLATLVSGTRAMLSAQLFVSIVAVALAGWTLSVTNTLVRERDRLRERVIQLEETLGARGIVVPAAPPVVETPLPAPDVASVYPGPIAEARPADAGSYRTAQTAEHVAEPALAERGLRIIGDLFSPAPTMRTVVLHVRSEADAPVAERIAREMSASSEVEILIGVMAPRDQRQSGYAYFDGRQSRAAADIVTQFHDIARSLEVATWSAQLRGLALPARGEYTADRLDITLPPLPAPPPPPADAP
jgi:hypothetical protein